MVSYWIPVALLETYSYTLQALAYVLTTVSCGGIEATFLDFSSRLINVFFARSKWRRRLEKWTIGSPIPFEFSV